MSGLDQVYAAEGDGRAADTKEAVFSVSIPTPSLPPPLSSSYILLPLYSYAVIYILYTYYKQNMSKTHKVYIFNLQNNPQYMTSFLFLLYRNFGEEWCMA